MTLNRLKILGVLLNLSLVKRNVSCTGNLLNVAMRDHGILSGLVDVDIYGIMRKLLILKNFHPNLETWKFKFHLDKEVRKRRSYKAEQIINKFALPYNAILQIGSEFNLCGIKKLKDVPKFSYHDSNLHAYLKGAWRLPKVGNKIRDALAYESEVYAGLTGIFVMTRYLREIFIRDFRVPEERVHYVGVGCNFDNVTEIQKEYDGKTILFIARHLFEQKGGKVVLEAFSKVRKEIPDARLILVGQDLSVDQPGVKCLGFINKRSRDGAKKLRDLYREASLFVMPSYYDALGNVFIEAMAHKVPCIGADCCAMPEIIVQNNCGYVIQPGDGKELAIKMCALLKNQKMTRLFGNNGFKAVRTVYNWDAVCKKITNVIEKYL